MWEGTVLPRVLASQPLHGHDLSWSDIKVLPKPGNPRSVFGVVLRRKCFAIPLSSRKVLLRCCFSDKACVLRLGSLIT